MYVCNTPRNFKEETLSVSQIISFRLLALSVCCQVVVLCEKLFVQSPCFKGIIHQHVHCTKEMKFSIKDFLDKCDKKIQFLADLITFTEGILNGELNFLCSGSCSCLALSNNILRLLLLLDRLESPIHYYV